MADQEAPAAHQRSRTRLVVQGLLSLVLLQGGAGGGRVLAALVGIAGLVASIVVFALMLRSEDGARRFGCWPAGLPAGCWAWSAGGR